MKRLLIPTVAVALAATAVVAPAEASAQDEAEPSPQAAYRQSLMQAFRLHMGGIRSSMGDAAPAGHAVYHAEAFQRMTQALANAFPEGSGGPGSRALPTIWENRMNFMDKVSAIQSAAADLVTAARGGDAEAIGAAVQAAQGTCGSCHQPYRSR